MPFTRMDTGTFQDWAQLQQAAQKWQSAVAERISFLLGQLAEQHDGMAINQLQHSVQTASRALRSGASEDLVVAALCHDIGTAISHENHAGIAAEILRPYVSRDVYEIVRTHQDFQRSHYHEKFGRNGGARQHYAKERWFRSAEQFSDEWDQVSFDPAYENLPIEYFLSLFGSIFAKPLVRFGVGQSDSATVRLAKFPRWLSRINRRVLGNHDV